MDNMMILLITVRTFIYELMMMHSLFIVYLFLEWRLLMVLFIED